jgi:hypothetical protein
VLMTVVLVELLSERFVRERIVARALKQSTPIRPAGVWKPGVTAAVSDLELARMQQQEELLQKEQLSQRTSQRKQIQFSADQQERLLPGQPPTETSAVAPDLPESPTPLTLYEANLRSLCNYLALAWLIMLVIYIGNVLWVRP